MNRLYIHRKASMPGLNGPNDDRLRTAAKAPAKSQWRRERPCGLRQKRAVLMMTRAIMAISHGRDLPHNHDRPCNRALTRIAGASRFSEVYMAKRHASTRIAGGLPPLALHAESSIGAWSERVCAQMTASQPRGRALNERPSEKRRPPVGSLLDTSDRSSRRYGFARVP